MWWPPARDAAAFEAAEQLIADLEAKGIEVIFDDRKKVSPGVKFKDAELIGVPLIAVAGRDTVNNGTIEVRDRNGENAEAVPVADAAQGDRRSCRRAAEVIIVSFRLFQPYKRKIMDAP